MRYRHDPNDRAATVGGFVAMVCSSAIVIAATIWVVRWIL